MIENSQFFDALQVSDVSVISGIRHCGKTVDCSLYGRMNSGILFVWSGEATFFSEATGTVVVSKGQSVFLPKNERYRMTYTAESTVFVVVNFQLHGKDGEEVSLFDGITLLATDDSTNQMAKIMTKFELCSAAKTVDAVLRKKELTFRLLGHVYGLGSRFLTKDEIDSQIVEGVRLLEQSYLENLPVARYAEASYVGVSTFRALFKKQFGTSPLKYRNYLRVQRAKELLSEGSFSVSEVAYQCGFPNLGYFCRYYRQVTGEAPGQTRKKNLGKDQL